MAETKDVVALKQSVWHGVLEGIEDSESGVGGPPVFSGYLGEGDIGGFDAGFGMSCRERECEDSGSGGDVGGRRERRDRGAVLRDWVRAIVARVCLLCIARVF